MTAASRRHRLALILGLALVVLAALAMSASAARAYTFNLTNARDWARAHYNDRLYTTDRINCWCTGLVSCTYRFGASVPQGGGNPPSPAAWWSDPDDWGRDTGPTWWSDSWFAAKYFRDHFNGYEPSGTTWVRQTMHLCWNAAQEDDRWSGGHVVFYHGQKDGACKYDYSHSAIIYGRHVRSAFGGRYGTCKVERTGNEGPPDGPYRNCNLINLSDRKSEAYRKSHYVQVNTLVNN